MGLPGGQLERDRQAARIGDGVDFRRQAAPRAPHAAGSKVSQTEDPVLSRQQMPLSTLRSSTRGTPRGLSGKSGSMTDHSQSVNS